MRILHLAKYYWPRSGGMERVVQGLAEGAANLGHQVEVVAVERPRQGRKLRAPALRRHAGVLLRGPGLAGDRAGVHRGGVEAGRHHPRPPSPPAGRRGLPAPGRPDAGRGDPARRRAALDVPAGHAAGAAARGGGGGAEPGAPGALERAGGVGEQGRGHSVRHRPGALGDGAAAAAGCVAAGDLHRPAGGLQGAGHPAPRARAGARAAAGHRGLRPRGAAAPDAGAGAGDHRPGALVRRVPRRGPPAPHGRRRFPGAAVGHGGGDVRARRARGDGRRAGR